MTPENLIERATAMLDNGTDYDDVEPGKCLGYYPDGVWLVDCSNTCNMADMPKLALILKLTEWERV